VKRCIVFGGSGTVGRAVCEELAASGAKVGFTFHQGRATAHELAARLDGAVAKEVDLVSVSDVGRVIDELGAELGGVDAFVHAAAVVSASTPSRYDRLDEIDEQGWNRMMAVNVTSALFACQRLARIMQGGNVVFIGSVDGVKALPTPVPYAASKAALGGMARALAKELGPKNIRVNVVAPGILESGMSLTLPDDLRREYLKHCGMRRFGRPSEIASLVSWMALENTYLTAQTVLVDGGL
jgi:3-oxoacyl-[acyl-carrier protein] reductase